MMKQKFAKKLVEFTYLFIIGCLLGYIFEVTYFIIKNGYFFNKKGMLYGPFKPIYGFGVILITIIFKPYEKKGFWFKYLMGCLIGTVFEYIGSYLSESILGIATWDYSHYKYSLNGRAYLPYCFIWGFITYFWMDYAYPFIINTLAKINKKLYNIIGYTLFGLMLFNFGLGLIVCDRAYERAKSISAENFVDRLIDKYFPYDVVRKRLPQLNVVRD